MSSEVAAQREEATCAPPRPPTLRRKVARPGRLVLLVTALAALPLLAAAGMLNEGARSSVLHVVISFAALLLAFRVIGKRELGRLSPFELVTLMLIPEILSNTVQGQGALVTALAGLSTILLLVLVVSVVAQRFELVQKVLEAEPTLLVADGCMLENNMNRERISPEELFGEMRKQGFAQLSEVRWAVLEPSGNVTFIPS
jgi:uncharacterized membrane protein YcaP (DUF421 family)